MRVCSFSSLNYPSGEAGLIFHENLKKYRMNISSVDVSEHKTHRSEACRQLICVPKLPPSRLQAQSLPCRHVDALWKLES